ncbi:MAG: amidohydrolase family protein [Actinobacteria bacterium]|nr:amidohydrolase family protein [Actinomycetota bacterium]
MLITNVITPSSSGAVVAVRVEDETVVAVGPGLVAGAGEWVIDGDGGLLTESLVETHAHLDKAYLAELIPNPTGDLMGAIAAMIANRHVMTVENTIERAERAVRTMVRNGVTTIRTHADVTQENGLTSVEALLEVRRRTAAIVDLQIVALLGWPLTGSRGEVHRQLGREAVGMGVDIIGGCPHLDDDVLMANADLVDLAGELEVPLDLHADEHTDGERTSLVDLAERVMTSGFSHGVTASHCVSLGMQHVDDQRATAEKLAEARVGVVALPQTNLFLQGRDTQSAMPRGLTAVKHLRDAGVLVAAGSDNLQDPFNPVGRGDPLDAAGLMVLAAHLLPADALASVTSVARAVVGVPAAGPLVGAHADLMVTPVSGVREMLATCAPRSLVVRRGRVVHGRGRG